ncbi:potassium transporter TrkA [Christiangramia fulva]|uniref:Potassium transporter TrkA n=1 Tax=Christiangramia fulva TaxID=2126553 RepID=A0A2R3Z5H3_9FLAO|nr:SLC13 family permease [Christiangramia fulva]AVR45474.1 potassium transporter TrkA [Christiangramia fulva]
MEIALVISLLILAIILFASEKYSVDVVTIGLLVILALFGIITPKEAFEGFSNDFIIILASIFVISGALSETGLLNKLGDKMIKSVPSRTIFIGYTMIITGALSAFMNNTTVTALVTGPVVGISKKLGLSPSKVLIPVAYASILGGTCTLIGTSTNVAVSGYMETVGLEPVSFFEIFGIGFILFITGFIFLLVFGNKLLPNHKGVNLDEEYNFKQYLSEIIIPGDSDLVGQQAFNSNLAKMEINIFKIIRGNMEIIPDHSTLLEKNDILLVECKINDLIKVKESAGIEVLADLISHSELQSDQIMFLELLITPGSRLLDKTLQEVKFRQNYNLIVLGIHRLRGKISEKIQDIHFKIGDVLLVQGTEEAVEAVRNSQDFSILGDHRVTMFRERKGLFAALSFLLAVILGSLQIIPLSIAFLSAALLTVISGAISAKRAYELMNWKLLILIGGMSAFGTAMHNSGASKFLAENIMNLLGGFGDIYILAGFVILVILLTQPMSNAAAALVILPIAIETAELLNVDPRSFAIAIMLGASVSLITPFEPSCILVYAPGRYRFIDFFKAGLPLTIILLIIILTLVPIIWPLH